MARLHAPLGALLLAFAGTAGCGDGTCGPSPGGASPADAAAADPQNEVLWLETKGVAGAETDAVVKAVSAVDGVRAFTWTGDGARVVRERGKAPDDAVFAAAKTAGADDVVKVPVATAHFSFDKPLHCAGCVKDVRKTVTALEGVKSAEVVDARKNLVVLYDTRVLKPADVEAALSGIKKPAKVSPAP
jgi:copper chaperone CopZ